MKEISKMLVIKLDHIGDLVLTIPALKALRKRYPNIQLDVMVNPKSQAVIQEFNEMLAEWERDRNQRQKGVNWQFTTKDARVKLKRLYPTPIFEN